MLGKSVRPHINELGREISIHRGRTGEEFERDWPGDLEILRQGWSGVDRNVVARFDATLIEWPRFQMVLVAAQWPPDRGSRIFGIVYIVIRRLRSRTSARQRAVSVQRI